MTAAIANFELFELLDATRSRLGDAGLALLACDETGCVLQPDESSHWLSTLFARSPLFRARLREVVMTESRDQPTAGARNQVNSRRPRSSEDQRQETERRSQHSVLGVRNPSYSEPREVFPGAWAVAVPIMDRRTCAGYLVAVIPTSELLESEQLAAMCQSAEMDQTLTRGLLTDLPPAASQDVPRLAVCCRTAMQDQLQMATGGQAMESVGQQLAESYEEIHLLYTITQNMTVQQRPENFITMACSELLATLSYAWVGVQLIDDRKRLKGLAGQMIVAGEPSRPISVVQPVVSKLLSEARAEKTIVLEPAVNLRHEPFAALGNSVVAHAISCDRDVMGLLIAGDKKGADLSATSVDIKLIAATAANLSIFLENAVLYEDLNTMFLGTLEALTASIDAKDRYTSGHSRRVAHLTARLAEAVGFDERTVSRMHIAGLVHDVGKIGVPEAVLLKPGRLTETEFAWIKKHPEMGYKILKDIPQMEDVLPGVLYHHERWEGGGYPHGIAGEAIPLVARLISLADAFDAMSSARTYRATMSRSQVIEEIVRNTGTQFDPALAREFVELDFHDFDRLVREHQARELSTLREQEEAA